MRIPRRRFNIPKPNVAFYTDGVSYFKIYSNRYIMASPDSLTITAGDEDLPSTDGLSKSNQEEFLKVVRTHTTTIQTKIRQKRLFTN